MKLLRKIGYGAAAIIIGSVATLLIQNWLDRPKLFVAVEEVGFVGSDDYVEVGAFLRELSEDDHWFGDLERFVKWSALSDRYESVLLRKGRLEVAIGIVEEWRKRELHNVDKGQLTDIELAEYPYTIDAILPLFGTVIKGSIRRRELGTPPVELSLVSSREVVAQYARDTEKWVVYGDTWLVPLPLCCLIGEEQSAQLELVVKSLAYGNRGNLSYYADRFINLASKDVRHLTKIEEELVNILYPHTIVIAKVTIFNSGNKPAVMEPYAALLILNEGIDEGGVLMRASPGVPAMQERLLSEFEGYNDLLESMAEDASDELSRQVDAVPLLPIKGRIQYVMVPPQGQATIELVADETLSDLGKRIREIYDLNLLEVRVVFSLLDGGVVGSDDLVFSSSASDSLRTKLFSEYR